MEKNGTENMLQIITNQNELNQWKKSRAKKVGFVPTMGNLHRGHLALLSLALKDHQEVVISIFINPKQFGPNEDYSNYPRTLKQDIEKIKLIAKDFKNSKIIVFAPATTEIIFPQDEQTSIRNQHMDSILCGKSRPNHFEGVCTVVYRLFSLIAPEHAYFGLKDYQQVVVIKKMVQDLQLKVRIITAPTVREESGLALSSRNNNLSAQQKENALILYRSLKQIADILLNKSWEQAETQVKKYIELTLKKFSNKSHLMHWDYLEVRKPETLALPTAESKDFIILGALYLDGTRLIDNINLSKGQ